MRTGTMRTGTAPLIHPGMGLVGPVCGAQGAQGGAR